MYGWCSGFIEDFLLSGAECAQIRDRRQSRRYDSRIAWRESGSYQARDFRPSPFEAGRLRRKLAPRVVPRVSFARREKAMIGGKGVRAVSRLHVERSVGMFCSSRRRSRSALSRACGAFGAAAARWCHSRRRMRCGLTRRALGARDGCCDRAPFERSSRLTATRSGSARAVRAVATGVGAHHFGSRAGSLRCRRVSQLAGSGGRSSAARWLGVSSFRRAPCAVWRRGLHAAAALACSAPELRALFYVAPHSSQTVGARFLC